jgi:SAM-dependent methyltransferase
MSQARWLRPLSQPTLTRPLSELERRAGGLDLRAVLRQAAERRSPEPPRVLELGMGAGRALLELRRDFPQARLHGLNHRARRPVRHRAELERNARHFGLEAPGARPVRLHFLDLRPAHLPAFATDDFDLVYSQSCFRYLPDKLGLVAEVWRVLAPGGVAVLHLGELALVRGPTELGLPALCEEITGMRWLRGTVIRLDRDDRDELGLAWRLDVERSIHRRFGRDRGWRSVYAEGSSPT